MKRINQILSVFLALLMIISIIPMSSITASATATSGSCGENLTWTFNESTGILTISGTGDMTNFEPDNCPWESYKSWIEGVLIDNGVTSIGNYAFDNCQSLVAVLIPDSVKTIGDYSFSFCYELMGIPISDNLQTIGDCAFHFCNSLTSVTIPDSVTMIGEDAFSFCKNLVSVTIGESVKTIGVSAFSACDNLTSVTIPDSVTTIGEWAFGSESLTSVIIGCGVTSIGFGAFALCDNLKDVYYSGTKEKWSEISIQILNEPLLNATIHFNSTGGSVGDEPEEPNEPEENKYYILGREFENNLDYYASNLNSSTYNPVLANMMAALSKAVYTEDDIIRASRTLGFDYYKVYDYYGTYNGNTCGYSLSFKQSDYNNDIICLVSVRGTQGLDYNADWYGNLNITTDLNGHHNGFQNPANRIYENIQNYINTNNITENIKFFVTGHSRGAAVANLLSVKLMKNGVASSNIYNYNFACPDVACKYTYSTYTNMFNLCNREDVVPFVPGILSPFTSSGTSWIKYGQTYWFTKDASNTLNPFADHDMEDIYLEFFDQQLNPSDWGYSFWDAVDDAVGWNFGWVAKILCPVDVIITDEAGNNIASVINGEINYYDSDFGDIIICTYGEEKVVYVSGEKDFNVELIGTDAGTMTYSIEKCNLASGEISESKTFTDVVLEDGKTMHSPVSEAEEADDVQLFVTEEKDGEIVYTHTINEDGTEDEYYTLSIKEPSRTTIRYKDGIILHVNVEGELPEDSEIVWYVNNDNFDGRYTEDGMNCMLISKNNGYTTVVVVLYDANDNIVATDIIEMRSKAGFFDKIGGFFRSLFGATKIYEN